MRVSRSPEGPIWVAVLLAACEMCQAFSPPQVFKNTNLLRTVDMSRGLVKETIAVIIENTSEQPQSEYYLGPFSLDELEMVSYVEAKDKKEGTPCTTEFNEDPSRFV